MTLVDIEGLAARVLGLVTPQRIVLLGIDGFGGAGKSTLAARLINRLGFGTVVAMDDFIVKDHMDDDSWEHGWDRARLRAQVLDPVVAGRRTTYQRLEWDSNSLSEPIPLDPDRLLITEGITALHPALRSLYDLGVWVDTPAEVARARGAARDSGNENEGKWGAWSANDRRYLVEHRPDLAAQLTILG